MRAFFLTLVGCLSVACGETEPSVTGTLTLDGGGHDGAIAEHPDARRDSRAARDAAVTADGEVCVDVEVSAADQACSEDSDCTFVGATGKVCATYCCGGGVPANITAAARIKAQEATIKASVCPGGCPAGPRPHCVGGSCIACPPGFEPGPPACVDASAPDGATCINIDATYPGTCAAVLLGTVCSSTCSCEANTAIPAMWLASYQSDLGGITLQSCHCPPAQATCVAGQCILCPSPGSPNPPMGCD
jgi:hypothetical protein